MSKIKTPQDKKAASLAFDARNVYGENDKSSRKAIPQRKQASHQALRRASKPLTTINSALDEDDLVKTEATLLSKEVAAARGRFRKRPDEPLGAVIAAKQTGVAKFTRKRK